MNWTKIKEWVRHNTSLTLGLALCTLLVVYAYGCQSTGASVLAPGTKVTASELGIEAKQITNKYNIDMERLELSLEDIIQQDESKQKMFEFGAAIVQTGTFNPLGLIGLAGLILTPAMYVNGRKKDTIIARDKTNLGDK